MARLKKLLHEIESYAQHISDTIHDPLLILDRELRVQTANRSFYEVFHTAPDISEGQPLYELDGGRWNIPVLLELLRETIQAKSYFNDFEVTHDFPDIGQRTILVDARMLYRPGNHLVLLVVAIEDVTERRRAEAELAAMSRRDRSIAFSLQRSQLFMPPEDAFPGLRVKTVYETASDDAMVGGDFWDTFAFGDGKVAFVLGDVMGKGLKAAVFTAEVKYTLRAFLREHGEPAVALYHMNASVCESHRLYLEGLNESGDDAPVCLLLAVIDAASGEGVVAVSGMEPLLIIRNCGRMEEVTLTGLPLGVRPNAQYDTAAFHLDRGDFMLMATDGITEARNENKFLGYAGLMRMAAEARLLETLEQTANCILHGAQEFAGGKLQDDACLLIARRT